MSEFYPSDQSEAFADVTIDYIKNLAEKKGITFEQAAKAAEIGVRAQQVDMLYILKQELSKIDLSLSSLCHIPDALNEIGNVLYHSDSMFCNNSED